MKANETSKKRNLTNILLMVVIALIIGLFAYTMLKNRKVVMADGTVGVEGDDTVNPPSTEKAVDKAIKESESKVS